MGGKAPHVNVLITTSREPGGHARMAPLSSSDGWLIRGNLVCVAT